MHRGQDASTVAYFFKIIQNKGFNFIGLVPPPSFDCTEFLIVFLIKQQLLFVYFSSPELLEESTYCETDVFVHLYPPQRFRSKNISVDLAVFTQERVEAEGVVIWLRDQQNIAANRDGP